MKVFLKVILSIFIIFILIVGGAVFYITRGLGTVSKMVINEVNISALKDGTYNGKYSSGRFSNEVDVVVKDHKIIKIDMVKDVAFPKPEWKKELFDRVVEKQSTDVDVVTGATVTSKAYLKSIENALSK